MVLAWHVCVFSYLYACTHMCGMCVSVIVWAVCVRVRACAGSAVRVTERYRDNGWRGLECEGGPLHTLFALLMYDVIFAPVVDVFRCVRARCDMLRTYAAGWYSGHFSDAPIDLDTTHFYEARSALIAAR